MAVATPPTGVSNGELIRWASAALNDHDAAAMSGGRTVSNFVVYDQMRFARQIALLPADGTLADRGAKAAFNARTRLLARLSNRRRS